MSRGSFNRMKYELPDVTQKKVKRDKTVSKLIPLYHVILLDDNDHSYDYVIEMLMQIFGHSREKSFQMAREVDTNSRVIVDTTHLERAEMKRDQIHSYGADWRIPHCQGSMSAIIEPVENQ